MGVFSEEEYNKYVKKINQQTKKNQPVKKLADPMTIARRAAKGASKNVSGAIKTVSASYKTMSDLGTKAGNKVYEIIKNTATNPEQYKKQNNIKPGQAYMRGASRNPIANLTAPGYTPVQRVQNLGRDLKSGATDFGAGFQKSVADTMFLPSKIYHSNAASKATTKAEQEKHIRALQDQEDFINRNYKTNGQIMSGAGYLTGEGAQLAASGGFNALNAGGKAAAKVTEQGAKQVAKAQAKRTIAKTAAQKGKTYTAKQLNNLANVSATAKVGNFAKAHPYITSLPKQVAENAMFGAGMYGVKRATGEEADLAKEMAFAQAAGLGLHAGGHLLGAGAKWAAGTEPVQNQLNKWTQDINNNPALSNAIASVNNFLNLNSGIRAVDEYQNLKRSLSTQPGLSSQQIDMVQRLNQLSPEDLSEFNRLVRAGVSPEQIVTPEMLASRRFGNVVRDYFDMQQNPVVQDSPIIQQNVPDSIVPQRVQPVEPQQSFINPEFDPIDDINLFNYGRTQEMPQPSVPSFDTSVSNVQPQVDIPNFKPEIDFKQQVEDIVNRIVKKDANTAVKSTEGINTPKVVKTFENGRSTASQIKLPEKVVKPNIEIQDSAPTKIESVEPQKYSEPAESKPQNIYEGVNENVELPDIDPKFKNARFFLRTKNGTHNVNPIKDGKWDENYVIERNLHGNAYYVRKNTPKVNNRKSIEDIKNEIESLKQQQRDLVLRGDIKKANKVGRKIKELKYFSRNAEKRLSADEYYSNESDIRDAYNEEFEELEGIGTSYAEKYDTRVIGNDDYTRFVTDDIDFMKFWDKYSKGNHNEKYILRHKMLHKLPADKRMEFLENIKKQEELEARRGQARRIGETKSDETISHENLESTEEIVNTAKDEGIDFNEKATPDEDALSSGVKKASENNWTKINRKQSAYNSTRDLEKQKEDLWSNENTGYHTLKSKIKDLEAEYNRAVNVEKDVIKASRIKAEINNVKNEMKQTHKKISETEKNIRDIKTQKINGFDAVKQKFERNKNNKEKLQEIYDNYTNDIVDSDVIQYTNTANNMLSELNALGKEYGVKTIDIPNIKIAKEKRIRELGEQLEDIKNGKTELPEGQSIESAEFEFIKKHEDLLNIQNNGDVSLRYTENGSNVTLGDVLRDHYHRTSQKQIQNIRDLTNDDWEVVYNTLKRMFPKDKGIEKLGEEYKGTVDVAKIKNTGVQVARGLYQKYYKVIKNSHTDFDAPINKEGHNFDFQDTRTDKVDDSFYRLEDEMKKKLGRDWDGNPWEQSKQFGAEDVNTKFSPKGDANKVVISEYSQQALKNFISKDTEGRIPHMLKRLKEKDANYMSKSKEELLDELKKMGDNNTNREMFSEYYDLKKKANAERLNNENKFSKDRERMYGNQDKNVLEDSNTFSDKVEDYIDSDGNVKLDKLDNAIEKLRNKDWVEEQIAREAEFLPSNPNSKMSKKAFAKEKELTENKMYNDEDPQLEKDYKEYLEEFAKNNKNTSNEYDVEKSKFIEERRKYYKDVLNKLSNTYKRNLNKYYKSTDYVNKVLTSGKGADKLQGKEYYISDLASKNKVCKKLTDEGLGNRKIKFEEFDDENFIAGLDTNTGDIVFNSNAKGTAFDHEVQHLKDWSTSEGKALLQRQADVTTKYKNLKKENTTARDKAITIMTKNGWTKNTKQIWSKLKKAGLDNNEIKILKALRNLKKEKVLLEKINEGRAELAERGNNVRSIQEYIKEKAGTEEGREIEKYYSDFIQRNRRRQKVGQPSGYVTRRYGSTRGLVAKDKKQSTADWYKETFGKEPPWKKKNKPINKEVKKLYEYFKKVSEEGTEKAVKYDIDLTAEQAINRQNMKSADEGLAVYFPKRGVSSSNGIDLTRDYAEEYLHKVGLYGVATKDTPQAIAARDGMNLITMNNKRDLAIDITEQVKNHTNTKKYDGNLEPGYKPINSSLMATALYGSKSKAFVDTLMKGEEAINRAFPKDEAKHWIEYMKRNSEPDIQVPESTYNQLFSGFGEKAKEYTLKYCQQGQIHGDYGKLFSALKYARAYNKVFLDLFKRDVLTTNSFVMNNRLGNTALLLMSSENPKELIDAIKTATTLKDSDMPHKLIGGHVADALRHSNKRLTITGDTEIDNFLNALYGNGVDLSKITKTIKVKGKKISSRNSQNIPVKTYGDIEIPNENYSKQMAKGKVYNAIAKYEGAVNKIRDAYANFNEKGLLTTKENIESIPFGEIFERKIAYAKGLNKVRKQLVEETGNKFVTQEELLKHVKDHPEIEESIIQSACDALGDYNSFSRFEQDVLKQIFPFYSWFRTISRHIVKNAMRFPERYCLFAIQYHNLMENEKYRRKSFQRGIFELNKHDERTGEQLGVNLISSTGNPFMLELPSLHPGFGSAKFLLTGEHDIGNVSSKKYMKVGFDENSHYEDKDGNKYNKLPVSARINSILMDTARRILFTNNKAVNFEQLAQTAATGYVPDKPYEDSFGGYRHGDAFNRKNQRYVYNHLSNKNKFRNWISGNKIQAIKPLNRKEKQTAEIEKARKWREKFKKK